MVCHLLIVNVFRNVDNIGYNFMRNWFGCCRVAESRLLLYKIVYENARLQLMHAKHGCLLVYSKLSTFPVEREKINLSIMILFTIDVFYCIQKRGQLLNSGVQNCEIMKLNYVRHLSTPGDISQIGYTHSHPSSVNSESKNKVLTLVVFIFLLKA